MNQGKRSSKADRMKTTHANDAVYHHSDHNYAVDRYKQRMPAVDVSSTEMKSRPRQHSRRGTSGYDEYSSAGLNSVRLNAEAVDVSGHAVDSCSRELHHGRLIRNNDADERRQKFTSRKKKMEKLHSSDFDQTNSASFVVPVSTEDGAVGFVDRQMLQDYVSIRYSQPNTSRDESFHHEDHLPAAAPVAVNVYSSEKVLSFESNQFCTTFAHKSEFLYFCSSFLEIIAIGRCILLVLLKPYCVSVIHSVSGRK